MGVAPGKIKRVARNGLNDTVRDLRKDTPSIIKKVVDRPASFSYRASVARFQRANYNDLSASIHISAAQARYLAPAEHGDDAELINTPISRDAFDSRGNVKKRFRWTKSDRQKLLAQVYRSKNKRTGQTRTVGKYFTGTPIGGGYKVPGLFMRRRDGKGLVRITAFTKRRRYRAIFGIRDAWREQGASLLAAHIREQARRSENQL